VRGAELHLPAGTWEAITPESAGWAYCGLRVVRLGPGERYEFDTGSDEFAVLPLAGSVEVGTNEHTFALTGRTSVFASVSDWAYLPMRTPSYVSSFAGAEIALASARADMSYEAMYVPATSVPVETRGAGSATRQIVNFLAPGAFDQVDRLICVEVLTPDGNWSSYPPHKHDDTPGSLANNEEIYYFRVGRTGTSETTAEGFALHRTYTADGSIDATVVVRDGDAFLVPRGYHGPTVAAPGYPLYYLNVMAGPNPERTMAIVDDPTYAWVRESWTGVAPDARVPMVSA
jgi:5-deoxy-glucuronate isomerase